MKDEALRLCKIFGKSKVSQDSGIPMDNLTRWEKKGTESNRKRSGRKIKNPDLESQLKTFVINTRSQHKPLSSKRFLVKAKAVRKELNIDPQSMTLSWGWYRKFLKRNGFSMRKPTSKIVKPFSEIENLIKQFKETMKEALSSGKYDPGFVINMDETRVTVDSFDKKTINMKGEGHVVVKSTGSSKEGITVALSVSMSGTKLDAFVIWPNAGKRQLKILYPNNLYIHYRPDGSWMDCKAMEIWVRHCLHPFALKLPKEKRGLLIIDNFEGHFNKEIQEKINELRFDILKLPPNTTPYLQPLDLTINKPFKNYYSDYWEAWISSGNVHPVTKKARNFEKPTREQTISWISKAWTMISSDLAVKSFNVYRFELEEPQPQDDQDDVINDDPDVEFDPESASDSEADTDDEDDEYSSIFMKYMIELDEINVNEGDL